MAQYEWKDHNNHYDPALIATFLLGIATATFLAFAL